MSSYGSNSNNETGSSNNDEINQKKKSVLIKDLQLKISVLTNGVIEERTKKSNLEKEIAILKGRIAEQELMLLEKESANTKIHNEKFKIQNELQMQKNRSSFGSFGSKERKSIFSIFQRKNSLTDSHLEKTSSMHESCVETDYFNENGDSCKVINEIDSLKFENTNYKKRIQDLTEDYNLAKQNYQFLINNQMEKIKSLEQLNIEKNKTLDENNKKLEVMLESYKRFDIIQTKYESAVNELEEFKAKYTLMDSQYQEKLKKQEKELSYVKKSLLKNETESANLAKKLAELKNVIIDQNIVIQSFKGERKGGLFSHSVEVKIFIIINYNR